MDSPLQLLFNAAVHLPPESREELAEQLYLSLHAASAGGLADVDAGWSEEISRRLTEVDSGAVRPIPAAEVIGRLRRKLDDSI